MLYLRWLEISRQYAERPAIFEGERVTTFADLATAVSLKKSVTSAVIARSGGVEFFVEILRAWRDRQPVILVERDALEPILQCRPPTETRLVKYTPGASGIARCIFFNSEQVFADGDRIVRAMKLSPAIPNLSVISLAHSYGFSNIVLPLILHGVPVHLAAVPFPRAIQEIFKNHAALVIPAVPSIWRAWHRAGILKNAPISFAISAGAPLALDLEVDIFTDAGLKIHNFYGASECGGISLDLSPSPRESGENVGTPLPGVEISIGDGGRLWIESCSVAMGYDVRREEDLLGNGRYLTRDLGHFNHDGKIHLTGTMSGAINVAGRKVSPVKVEAAILATGLVQCVKISGIPSADRERVQEITAQVTLKNGVTLEELKCAATHKLHSWEIPRHWNLDHKI